MRVKRILARLRKERQAIDEAIAALEQIGDQPKSFGGKSSARSRNEDPVPPADSNTILSQSGPAMAEIKVIDFRQNRRTG